MTQERWQEVKAILASALERAPEERRVYLDQACTEPALRREVQSLIDAHEHAETTFMEEPLAVTSETLKSGTKLGPYEILARIGAGGMGVVYRARDERLERDVAIKVLSMGLLADQTARKRFRKEALALAKLNHPNIAAVYDVGEQEGTNYLVMECVLGNSLAGEVISGPVPEKDVLALGAQMAAALEEAHEHGIVHRDLKPANIMVTPKRQVKVLDFGLARILRTVGDFSATESLTQNQNIAGTLAYMAPEQLRGEPADARTDIHALGAVLFEIATGKRLYQEDSVPRLADAILNQPPVAPRALNARVSPELERIVLKCLEKEPENRYQSAKELGVDLRHLGAPHTVTSAPAAALASPRSRRSLWPLIAGAAALVVVGTAGAYFYFHRMPKLTEKDSIVVADFANSTGDPVFDGTLRQGLTAQLQQTPFLQLVSGDRITQALHFMEKPANTALTQDVARQICQRVNATAVINGSIAALGGQYVLGLDALNCSTGEILDQEQVTADGKERVLAVLGTAASELRKKLGESAASLQTYDVPFDQAITTSSLEALQAYTRGTDAFLQGDLPSAISFLRRAVTIDPNFATAYSVLGIAYTVIGEPGLSKENLRKAWELRDRVSEREKFSIAGNYYLLNGDFEKGRQACEEWTKVFPRDPPAYIALAATSAVTGKLGDFLAAAREALRLDPTAYTYNKVTEAYVRLGRLDEAGATIQQAVANHIDPSTFRERLYDIAFLRGDLAEMAKDADGPWFGPPEASALARAATAAHYGRAAHARDLLDRARESAKRRGAKDLAAQIEINGAVREVLFGNFTEAEQAAREALDGQVDEEVEGLTAIVFALTGNPARAQKLAEDLNRRAPDGTMVQFNYLPAIQAALALAKGNQEDAVASIRSESPYELAAYVLYPLLPIYMRGQVYLEVHQGAEAAGEFQKILDQPGVVLYSPTAALAHLGLARAYAMQGDTAKAKAAYQDFLTLWKDADQDIPILKEAKAEYAKLR